MRPCQIRKRRPRAQQPRLNRRQLMEAAMWASAAAGLSACAEDTGAQSGHLDEGPRFPAAVAGFRDQAGRVASVRAVVEMLGGMPWIKPGDHVLIKPAHNSPNPYPFTASPESCAELTKMCLEAGAGRVTIADCMGVEHTMVPGGWHLESPFGRHWLERWDPDDDATVLAMRNSGLYDGIVDAVGAGEVGSGSDKRVHITSFRQHGWRRFESESVTPGAPTMHADWVKSQLEDGVNWDGELEKRVYLPRKFDLLRSDEPGMMLPRIFDEVDHVINVHRCSTHIWSHATHALKNWIGVQRPDERLWMHQLNYLKNRRHAPDDPASTECPYHEMLAELHMATWERERLVIADASLVTLSGGPDDTVDPFYPANLMIGATDLVSADVLAVAVVKMGVLASLGEGGLNATCLEQPKSNGQLFFEFIDAALPWRDTDGPFHGTDVKLCDPTFSPWDWLAIRRAAELGMGPQHAGQLDLRFGEGDFGVPDARRGFIEDEIALPARFS